MYDQRCYVSCAQLDSERLIALGGYNNRERLKSAEIFHIPTNQWHRIADMDKRRLVKSKSAPISILVSTIVLLISKKKSNLCCLS